MLVWRICRRPHARDTLKGRGGLLASGRWHTRGRPVVYASESLSLACLEILVHVDRETAPGDLVSVEIQVPDDIRMIRWSAGRLPRGWRDFPPPSGLQERGDRWLSGGATAVLKVPSALIPEEHNVLINPLHEDISRLRVRRVSRFSIDARLV